jgi:hypothetical protein
MAEVTPHPFYGCKVEPARSELYEGKRLTNENTGKSWMPLEGQRVIRGGVTKAHGVGVMHWPLVGMEAAQSDADTTDTVDEPQSIDEAVEAIEKAAETLASAKRGKDAARLAKAARRIGGETA